MRFSHFLISKDLRNWLLLEAIKSELKPADIAHQFMLNDAELDLFILGLRGQVGGAVCSAAYLYSIASLFKGLNRTMVGLKDNRQRH